MSDLWRSTQRAVSFSHRSLATFACFHTERLAFKIRRRGETSADRYMGVGLNTKHKTGKSELCNAAEGRQPRLEVFLRMK